MSDAPLQDRLEDGQGLTQHGGAEVLRANRLLTGLIGQPLVQFRMGYGIHLELGDHHEVTIETSLAVKDGDAEWSGEPLTAEAAGALLPLHACEVTSADVARNGRLTLGVGPATLTVPASPMYEAWQVRGPRGLLIVCSPGGEYVAVWEPQTEA